MQLFASAKEMYLARLSGSYSTSALLRFYA